MIKKTQIHLKNTNESYFKHMVTALKIALQLLSASFMALMHAILPALFTKGASSKIKELYIFIENRNKR